MKKQTINKVLAALLNSTVVVPAYGNPIEETAVQIATSLVDTLDALFPLTSLAMKNQKTAIALAIVGGAMLGGVTAFTIKKITNYLKGKDEKSSTDFTSGAIGGACAAIAAVPIAYNILNFGAVAGSGIAAMFAR